MGFWSFLRGTTSNTLGIGDGVDSAKTIEANVPGTNKPALRFNHTTDKWEFSHNGVDFSEFGSGGASDNTVINWSLFFGE